jgi:hypothetical protein
MRMSLATAPEMNCMRLARSAAMAVAAALLLAGCAQTEARLTRDYDGPPLPRPDRVMVHDFAVSPDDVQLDRGLSPRVLGAIQDTSKTSREVAVGRDVAQAISANLVEEIRRRGLPAERAVEPLPYSDGNVLLIEGQILSVDEGDRTRRNLIGLGAGRTRIEADAQVLYLPEGATAPFTIETFEAAASSGRKPGMLETMGVGAAADQLATAAVLSGGVSMASEAYVANIEADGARLGKQIAESLVPLFEQQGWLPASAAR